LQRCSPFSFPAVQKKCTHFAMPTAQMAAESRKTRRASGLREECQTSDRRCASGVLHPQSHLGAPLRLWCPPCRSPASPASPCAIACSAGKAGQPRP
jgi:hypothetical protein